MESEHLEILISSQNRADYIAFQSKLRGLKDVSGNPNGAYCPISLANIPENVKDLLHLRQHQTKKLLQKVGIDSYDPATAPFSPDINRFTDPRIVYGTDAYHIAANKFFIGHIVVASSGFGTESEIAAFGLVRMLRVKVENPELFYENK